MTTLSLRHNEERDLAPLAGLLKDEGDMALVNPHARYPFDEGEWKMRWLQEVDDDIHTTTPLTAVSDGLFAWG